MYKAIKLGRFIISVGTFPKTAKKVSLVYHTGFRYWEAQDGYNYSLVLGCSRVIFCFEKKDTGACPG